LIATRLSEGFPTADRVSSWNRPFVIGARALKMSKYFKEKQQIKRLLRFADLTEYFRPRSVVVLVSLSMPLINKLLPTIHNTSRASLLI
jgi:hypothetical protein